MADAIFMFKPTIMPGCRECRREMTGIEMVYYRDRCEECESAWNARVERWRHGGEDAELDRRFGV